MHTIYRRPNLFRRTCTSISGEAQRSLASGQPFTRSQRMRHTYLRAHTMPAPYAPAPLSACSILDAVQLAASPWPGCFRVTLARANWGTGFSRPGLLTSTYMRGDFKYWRHWLIVGRQIVVRIRISGCLTNLGWQSDVVLCHRSSRAEAD